MDCLGWILGENNQRHPTVSAENKRHHALPSGMLLLLLLLLLR
jgi:hypothetical protein